MKKLTLLAINILLTLTLRATVDLGELSRDSAIAKIPAEIVSANPQVSALAQQAFSVHGGYELQEGQKATYVFRLDQVGASKINLTIESGHPKIIYYEYTTQGETLNQATLKACDKAVEKTLHIPGFFASQLTFVGFVPQDNKPSEAADIFISDLFSTKIRRLTHDYADALSPNWSSNGKRIVYTSYYKSGFPDIFQIDLESGQRRSIAEYSGINTGGAYSPSDEKLAMVLSSSGNPELYIADKAGKKPKRITKTKALEASPCWGHDDNTLYIASDPMGAPQIYQVDIPTGQLTRIETNISKYCAEPACNPLDSNVLAFTAAVNKTFQIAVFDKNNSHPASFLTDSNDDFIEPTWMCDGRHLIVTKRSQSNQQLWLLDSVSGKLTQLPEIESVVSRSMASAVYPKL